MQRSLIRAAAVLVAAFTFAAAACVSVPWPDCDGSAPPGIRAGALDTGLSLEWQGHESQSCFGWER